MSSTYPLADANYGFVFASGTVTTGISGPGATYTLIGPANNHGLAIGNFGDFTTQHATFYDTGSGTFTPLPDITGMPLNFGNGINAPRPKHGRETVEMTESSCGLINQ
jgi:hypothetical protein